MPKKPAPSRGGRAEKPPERPQERPVRPKAPGAPPEHLTNAQKRHLRGLGHALRPLVQVGKEGVTDGLLTSVREALIDHELVKVKLNQNCDLGVADVSVAVADGAGAALVQRIGKTFLLYAPHPTEPTIVLPR